MGFRLLSVTLNDLEQRNNPYLSYFALFHRIWNILSSPSYIWPKLTQAAVVFSATAKFLVLMLKSCRRGTVYPCILMLHRRWHLAPHLTTAVVYGRRSRELKTWYTTQFSAADTLAQWTGGTLNTLKLRRHLLLDSDYRPRGDWLWLTLIKSSHGNRT